VADVVVVWAIAVPIIARATMPHANRFIIMALLIVIIL
jgi:hypothetical protein